MVMRTEMGYLGEQLIKMGIVTEEQLKKALELQAKNKAKGIRILLGQALTQLGYCKEEDIARAMRKNTSSCRFASRTASSLLP